MQNLLHKNYILNLYNYILNLYKRERKISRFKNVRIKN